MKKWIPVIALVFGCAIIGHYFVREWIAVTETQPTSWFKEQKADCAVVLTGGPGRVREGLDLLAQKAVQKLIISGVHPKASLKEIFPQWPYYGDLSEDDVVLERRSGTTYGNAQQSLPLVEALRCRNILLVTSALHMHRAYRTFRGVFPKEMEIKTRAVIAGRYHPKVEELFWETFKSLFYSLWAY
jgi:uncharacterized SAM-binding protein YcdF (DUF218 family)